MKELDYYTVMESRINYFSRKYDPQNKLGTLNTPVNKVIQVEDSQPGVLAMKPTVRNKIKRKLDFVVAMFL